MNTTGNVGGRSTNIKCSYTYTQTVSATYLTTAFPISSMLSIPTDPVLVTFELMRLFLVFVKIFIVADQCSQRVGNK
jgi:hypothetical protein